MGASRSHGTSRRRRLVVLAALALTAFSLPAALAVTNGPAPAPPPAEAGASERIVVRLDQPLDAATEAELASSVDGKVIDIGAQDAFAVETPAGKGDAAVRTLKANKKVKKAEHDLRFHKSEVVPNEPCFSGCTLSFDGGTTGQTFRQTELMTIGAPAAWSISKGSPEVLVAVLDTDVNTDQPDLQGKVIVGPNLSGDSEPDPEGHGTEVAGLIAATPDNGVGIAGLGWNTRVLSVRVLDRAGAGYASKIAQGVRYAADYPGVRVINLSLEQDAGEGNKYSNEMADAVAYARKRGVLVVAAAGNQSSSTPTYPAAFDGVLSVGAVGRDDSTASFSNRGPWVDVAAPGVENLTLSGACECWTTPSGTSFAAPLVSAAAALLLAVDPWLTPDETAARFMQTAVAVAGSGTDIASGRIDVAQALSFPPKPKPTAVSPTSAPPATPAPSATAAAPAAGSPRPAGYWLAAADGGVFTFGNAGFFGSTGAMRLNKPIVGMSGTQAGLGYWMVASDGGIFAFGDAPFHGSTGDVRLNQPIVAMAPNPTGKGYWLVAADGGVFAFGDAGFFGSTGAMRLNKPIVGLVPTPTGLGYWLVASDGGIFAFGDAVFHGSAGALPLSKPVAAMAATPTGGGYWMVASDGGIFAFGDAVFHGAVSGKGVTDIVAIGPSKTGGGYWLAGADGSVYRFGDVPVLGDLGRQPLNQPIVSLAVR